MQLIILRGYKELPWNETRKQFVCHFFSKELLPDFRPYIAKEGVSMDPHLPQAEIIVDQNVRETTTVVERAIRPASTSTCVASKRKMQLKKIFSRRGADLHTPNGSKLFWKRVMWFARQRKIRICALLEVVREDAKRRKKRGRAAKSHSNIVKIFVNGLFEKRGTSECFRQEMAIALKTNNVNAVINVIRSRLNVVGLGYNIVPSIRTIQSSTATLVTHFSALCKPQLTFSGFRLDLVSTVKLAAFLIFNKSDLNGVCVDIWGDGCEIGGLPVTRLAFRLINSDSSLSSQSTDAVFCFAGNNTLITFH